ncbi:MAG: tetratricopeptide repeat protein [Cyanophyceae cyanobacterium]
MVKVRLLGAMLAGMLLVPGIALAQGQSLDQLIEQGERLRGQGDFRGAEQVFQRMVREFPRSSRAFANLCNVLDDLNRLDEARRACLRAVTIDDENQWAHFLLGYVARRQGNLYAAIASYDRAIELNPNDATAYNNRGNALRAQGKLAAAIASYRQALSLPNNRDPVTDWTDHTYVHNGLGFTFQKQRRFEEAIEQYKKALALDPNYTTASTNLREAERQLALSKTVTPNSCTQDKGWIPNDDPYSAVNRSIVFIYAEGRDTGNAAENTSDGTGWVIRRQGNKAWILTNRHVITGQHEDSSTSLTPLKEINVDWFSEPPANQVRCRQKARLVQQLEDPDLALLEVDNIPKDIQPLKLNFNRPNTDDDIRMIGHPTIGNLWSLSRGYIGSSTPTLQINNSDIAKGNSGGPILNQNNQVIGIVFEIAKRNPDSTGNFAFGYSLNQIQDTLRRWQVIDTTP